MNRRQLLLGAPLLIGTGLIGQRPLWRPAPSVDAAICCWGNSAQRRQNIHLYRLPWHACSNGGGLRMVDRRISEDEICA